MKILVCSNDYTGFLTAIYAAFYHHKDAECITSDTQTIMLVDDAVRIEPDTVLAKRVYSGMLRKYGKRISDELYECFLADIEGKGNVVFRFIKLLAKYGKSASKMYQRREVIDFYSQHSKVKRDATRIIQFVRLQEMESGVFYAPFNSDHDVIELLLPHFRERFNTLRFVLHDLKRGKMIYYDKEKCHYGFAPESLVISFSEEEKSLRAIWKNYVKNIAIKARINKKLQDSFMPHRYRSFMHEFFKDE